MIVTINRWGWYFLFRHGSDDRDPFGFVIKLRRNKIFSERYIGYAHEMTIGPLYFRTYKRKPKAERDRIMRNPKERK